jgi:nucleoside-diphosphate-sugar epimerase
MRVFVLGGTGSIGSAIIDELLKAGHHVLGLARSEDSARILSAKGVSIVAGDIRDPAKWSGMAAEVDGIVHAAATFTDDMVDVDRVLTSALIDAAKHASAPPRFVYTGGCWLYGETGDTVATEDTPFDPIESLADHGAEITATPYLEGMIVHPAMVYERDGGVFSRFAEEAKTSRRISIVGSAQTRWPLVHKDDLAVLYRLVLEKGLRGSSYNGATEHGVRVGDIVDVMSARFNLPSHPLIRSVEDAVAEYGDWAAGYALDQQMSGEKARAELGWNPSIRTRFACSPDKRGRRKLHV